MTSRRSSVSRKTQQIKSFIAMDILEAAQGLKRQGREVISFSLGEPDFAAPQVVKEATIRAIRADRTKYTHSQGLPQLRAAIALHYKKKYGVTVDPERIIVTPGTSPAFYLIFSALLERGDEVILPDPHYPCDRNFVEFFDGTPRFLKLSHENGFHWDMGKLRRLVNRRTRAIFLTSPANPTGAVFSADEYRALARTGKFIIADEIYHGLSYDVKEHTALEFTERCFVINGFSKAYAMTGFRLGYVIAPPAYVRAMQKVQQNFTISTASFVQEGGIAALKYAQKDIRKRREEYRRRRDLMLKGLKEIGLPAAYIPEGAFYIMTSIRHLTNDSYKFAFDLLRETGVAVTPGIDFGAGGEGFLRFSYAVKPELIRKGLKRIGKWLSLF